MAKNKYLIVDDDPIILILHKRLLKKLDLVQEDQIYSCNSGLTCLKLLSKNPAEFEDTLILLDINMPGMNGWQFIKDLEMLKGLEKIKVVMVSSSIDESDKEKTKNHGLVMGYLEKPISLESLQEQLDILGLD